MSAFGEQKIEKNAENYNFINFMANTYCKYFWQ